METSSRSIGVGLVSVGWMGRLHSRAYTLIPHYYPELGIRPVLVTAADVAEQGRDYATSVLGFRSSTADYRAVIEDPAVDVVSICAPNALHREIAVAAAAAGKPFWLEKPAGRTGAETEEIAAAATQAGVVTCVGFNYRHTPAVLHARELIESGALGRITNIRGRFFGGFSSDPEDPLTWRFTRESGGSGVLNDLMGHLVDLIQFLLGTIGSVAATTGTFIEDRPLLGGAEQRGAVENEDYATMLVEFAPDAVGSGALGSLEASRIAVGPKSEYGFEIFGTEGSLRWEFERLNELEVALTRSGPHVGYTRVFADRHFPGYARFQPSSGTGMGYDDLKTIEASLFLQAVLGGPALAGNIHDAVAASRVNDAAEASAATHAWQDIVATAGTTSNNRD
ncbi:Gfo/Idh/MocA family protein [Microbacterium esteraromaticum]|uniref:Gfo/Idh/MocA family protein n=1 Tax=Microbacterium esteraromaticum TaxID=57043 RepID=UPI000B361277|nr:Gfo/Idh/MocA family oxidoreductase [Microbacterium esteraromaticum]